MANTNMTRTKKLAQKKVLSFMAELLKEGTDTDKGEILAASGNYLIGYLPPDAIIKNASIHVKTASDAATSTVATLGTAEAGTEILSAGDLKSTGKQGTFTGESLTGSGVGVYLGITYTGAATAVGEYIVEIEYLEYTKTNGEYTKMDNI